jgi:hypothetical protein
MTANQRCFDPATHVNWPSHEESVIQDPDDAARLICRGYCTRCGEVVDEAAYRRWRRRAGETRGGSAHARDWNRNPSVWEEMTMNDWCVIVNENMHDARAYILHVPDDAGPDVGLSGWERIYSAHATREEAEAALADARDYARGRAAGWLPPSPD